MSVELLYTSAPTGLKPGSRGFCTVLSTAGTPVNLATRLETLSGYRHVYTSQDAQAALNPVTWSHVRVAIAGQSTSILSRIADYGVDYSGRTNKLAHHLVVSFDETIPAGPAWLLSRQGLMRTSWNGQCQTPSAGPSIPYGEQQPAMCSGWQSITGDAGWGGVVAQSLASPAGKPLWIIYAIEQREQLLGLLNESIALLPVELRWQATFSTYYTNLPPEIDCKVRCVLVGTEEAKLAGARGFVVDLTRTLTNAPINGLTTAARTGGVVRSLHQVEPALSPTSVPSIPAVPKPSHPGRTTPPSQMPQLPPDFPPAVHHSPPPLLLEPPRLPEKNRWVPRRLATIAMIGIGLLVLIASPIVSYQLAMKRPSVATVEPEAVETPSNAREGTNGKLIDSPAAEKSGSTEATQNAATTSGTQSSNSTVEIEKAAKLQDKLGMQTGDSSTETPDSEKYGQKSINSENKDNSAHTSETAKSESADPSAASESPASGKEKSDKTQTNKNMLEAPIDLEVLLDKGILFSVFDIRLDIEFVPETISLSSTYASSPAAPKARGQGFEPLKQSPAHLSAEQFKPLNSLPAAKIQISTQSNATIVLNAPSRKLSVVMLVNDTDSVEHEVGMLVECAKKVLLSKNAISKFRKDRLAPSDNHLTFDLPADEIDYLRNQDRFNQSIDLALAARESELHRIEGELAVARSQVKENNTNPKIEELEKNLAICRKATGYAKDLKSKFDELLKSLSPLVHGADFYAGTLTLISGTTVGGEGALSSRKSTSMEVPLRLRLQLHIE